MCKLTPIRCSTSQVYVSHVYPSAEMLAVESFTLLSYLKTWDGHTNRLTD